MSSNFTKHTIFENEKKLKNAKKTINLIHFNDVYNVESGSREPVGGAARFVTAVEKLKEEGPTVVLFSGDAISPSNISMLVKGKQMIEVLNQCQIDCACLGNHDFDFGMDVLLQHIKNSNFPWLISNVFDAETKKPLGNVKDRHVIEVDGVRIGLIGLVEVEWITTLSTISADDIIYDSYIETGKRIADELREENKCDLVIALTHMRWNNDKNLAENCPEIDLFLGGHDHDYVVKNIKDRWVIKSGTDFREFSYIQISLNEAKISSVDKIEKFIIDSKIEENQGIKQLVDSYLENINKELDTILGHMNVELDGRFSKVRSEETNLGNFVCDIMLAAVNVDCAFLNSGTLRSDCVHLTGEFRARDLKKILPYLDENVVLSITGRKMHQILENSVSQYPNHEGRFLQVAGIKFAFDPRKPSGSRVDPTLVQIQDEYLDLEKEYTAITKNYLRCGKDGYECLVDCPVLIDEENLPVLYNLVENHFKTIEKLRLDRAAKRFRSSIVPLVLVNRLIDELSQDPNILGEKQEDESHNKMNKLNFHNAAFLITKVLSHRQKVLSRKERLIIKESDKFKQKMNKYEETSMKLEPKLENRIIRIIDDEHYKQLLIEREANLEH